MKTYKNNDFFKIIKNHKNIAQIIILSVIIQFAISILSIFIIANLQIKKQLEDRIQEIITDARFDGSNWDLSLYNNNPNLLDTNPLYFFTLDGYILDRRSPIKGFLDTTDFKKLLSYSDPQTIKGITGQLRRVYAKPVMDNGKPIAVVAVSYHDPSEKLIDEIDSKLVNTVEYILANISTSQREIDFSNLNVKLIPYDVSYTVVDSYNSILSKTVNLNSYDRIPNFIDPSYIKNIVNSYSTKIVRDTQTKELFLIKISPVEKNSNVVAVVAVGKSIKTTLDFMKNFTLFQGISGLFIGCISLIVALISQRTKKENHHNYATFTNVEFSEKTGILTINGVSLEIPYATNQFYLLKMLFSKPGKRWEIDMLLDGFGEELTPGNSRKVYDAMISINKKVLNIVPLKLIIIQNRTYLLNQEIFKLK